MDGSKRLSTEDLRVRYEPDHEAPTFDDDGAPFLAYGRHPEHGWGWTLSYLDETDGVESYFTPGDLKDIDLAVESARSWLRLEADQPEE